MPSNIKAILFALPVIALLVFSPTSRADGLACHGEFEGKTVRIIVPNSTGGGYDTFARRFAPHYEKTTGARVLVENWPAGKGRVGATKIMQASADGLTIGVMDASKRLVDHLLSDGEQPSILEDFTLLGRYARTRQVLLTGKDSAITAIEALFDMDPPPVLGTKSSRSSGLLATVLLGDLLQFQFNTVTGLGSKSKRVLAVSRGDIDLISSNYDSVVSDLETGTVRALLQISSSAIADDPLLENIPLLGGRDGIAALRASGLGLDVDKAVDRARAVEALISAGRVIAAPAGLPDDLKGCVQAAVLATLESDGFAADIQRSNMALDIASGPATIHALAISQPEFEQLIPILRRAIDDR